MTNQTTVPASSMAYRPRDYFGRYDLEAELMTRVKGTLRRKLLREAIETGNVDQMPPGVRESALDETNRRMLGRIHPMYMGGEYLPRVKSDEVEIARLSIQSTTGDVVCLYARPVGIRIAYRMADEYQGSTLESPSTRTSMRPLTMGEMISFFLKSWNLFECLDCNYPNALQSKLDFFSAESEYYPYFDDILREQVVQREKLAEEPQC
jgi:hypothetical protein